VTVEKLFFVTGSGSRFKIESNSMAVVDPVIGVQILWLVVPQVNHCRKIGADVGDAVGEKSRLNSLCRS
jgi:hypothetical protein